MKMGAWNVYRGLYCVQPAPGQKTAPMTGNPRNPAIYLVTSPPTKSSPKNEYEKNFPRQKFSLNLYFAWTT